MSFYQPRHLLTHLRHLPCGRSLTLLSLGIALATASAEDTPPAVLPGAAPAPATPPAPGASPQQMQERLQTLEDEVRTLQARDAQAHAASASAPAAAATQPAFVFGAYGEMKYGAVQNPDANGQWQNGFDGGRLIGGERAEPGGQRVLNLLGNG